jgi:hypothetical protein
MKKKELCKNTFTAKAAKGERKRSARLTHGYMDGGATFCAELCQIFISEKLVFR